MQCYPEHATEASAFEQAIAKLDELKIYAVWLRNQLSRRPSYPSPSLPFYLSSDILA